MGDILFLAHRIPFPPNRGDKIRAHHLLKRLTKLAPVHVGCFAESDADRAAIADLVQISASQCVVDRRKPLVLAGVEAMLASKPVSLTAFHSQRLEHWVRQTLASQPIDKIVIFSGQMGQYIPDDFGGRVLVDLCDVDSAKFASYAESGERPWLNQREARLLASEEERLGHRAEATILISESEGELYRSQLQQPYGVNVQIVGNGIDTSLFDPDKVSPHPDLIKADGPQICFVGQMDYRPNEEAVLWAIEELLPRLRDRFGDARLHVVGRSPTKALLDRKGEAGLQVWGEVPDVRPFVAGSDAVIAPLAIARGIQNKVLEAMAMARPVVLTEEAATGITAINGDHWQVCERLGEAMADAIETLFRDSAAAQRLGANARSFVEEHHSWPSMLQPLEDLLAGRQEARNAA